MHARRNAHPSDDHGVAVISVIMGLLVLALVTASLFAIADQVYDEAAAEHRDDRALQGAESMLERYAAKLNISPNYFSFYVDEAERARVCNTGAFTGTVVEPGNNWSIPCPTWDYQDPAAGWYQHTLLEGANGEAAANIEAQIEIIPPTSGPVRLNVVVRDANNTVNRGVTAEIAATSISEFAFLVDQDLTFGRGADIAGQIYVGRNLNFVGTPIGIVRADVFAENDIVNLPNFQDGAVGYEGKDDPGNRASLGDIRDIYPTELDFNSFWDDLDSVRLAGCSANGLCLDDADARGWKLRFRANGTIDVWKATANPWGCSSTQRSWRIFQERATWNFQGNFPYPNNGVIWTNEITVLSNGDANSSTITDSVTVMAGSSSNPVDIIVSGDIEYADPANVYAAGWIATDELWIDPTEVGPDNEYHVHGAILTQGGSFHTATSCGGSILTSPSNDSFTSFGSFAMLGTGDMSRHFSVRNYGYDPRNIRPPLFPLLDGGWGYEGWQETIIPVWAR